MGLIDDARQLANQIDPMLLSGPDARLLNNLADTLEKLNGFAEHKERCLDMNEEGYPICTCGLDTLRAQIFGETSDGE